MPSSDQPPNFKLHRNVILGEGCVVGDYAIVGLPPSGKTDGELTTRIGANGLIRSHTVIYAGNVIGAHFATGHGVLLREENEIGDRVSIGSHSVIEHHVKMGNRVRVHSATFIPEFSILEDDAWIGPNVTFTNVLHPLCPEVSKCIKGPHICRGAKIGAGATVLPTVVIGEMAMIGAGAVVTENVPPRMVVVGNPARIVKSIDEIKCPWDYIAHPYPPPVDPT
ncbi:MAG: N-acetyltransferase [Candidatus Sumerlaeaceae bacterium]|nr:N-acetyltransferase [Candidatus Sumerlaeaceae bacterium]